MAAAQTFESFVGALMAQLPAEDIPHASPKELTFKLQRDTRFSHDKSPYNPAFRAHIGPSGKLPIPVGYYIVIRPGDRSFLGGGLFADMFKGATLRIRSSIADHSEEWADIIGSDGFAQRFAVHGAALQKVPAGYDPSHPQAQWLKHKRWYLEYPLPDAIVADAGFAQYAAAVFLQMRDFNRFLNRALTGFQMPSR